MNLKTIGALAASAAFLIVGLAAPANAYPHIEPGKVVICHATGSATNPYVEESVAYASILEGGHGSSGVNAGDIIPSFTADDGQVFLGQNFSANNQHIWENDCGVPTPTPTTPPVTACPGVVTDQPGLKNMAGGPDAPCPPIPTGPSYVSVIWAMPRWANATTAVFPQTLVSSAVEATPTFREFPTTCGTQYQQDIYWNNATTTQLIAAAKLTAPNHPAEDLIPGGLGTAWTFHQNEACVSTKPTTPPTYSAWTDTSSPKCGDTTKTQTRTETDTDYTLVSGQWKATITTKTDTQTVPLSADELTALTGKCQTSTPAPTPTVTQIPPATQQPPTQVEHVQQASQTTPLSPVTQLAHTGKDVNLIWPLLAALVVLLGIAARVWVTLRHRAGSSR